MLRTTVSGPSASELVATSKSSAIKAVSGSSNGEVSIVGEANTGFFRSKTAKFQDLFMIKFIADQLFFASTKVPGIFIMRQINILSKRAIV